MHFLDTGKSLNESKPTYAKTESSGEISLDSRIGENFKCSEDKRQFFEKEIGKGFKFKVNFQKWLKANPDKTYRDAIDAYLEIQSSNRKNCTFFVRF